MKVKCEFCGNMIDDTLENCPHCGAANNHMARTASDTPKTIAELAKWYEDRHLPPYETTRFFIGIDYQQPKAFGIYEKDGVFTVYKNKVDGSRAVRYTGTDEAYAVNELYLRLKAEILNQKAHQAGQTRAAAPVSKKKSPMLWILSGAVLGIYPLIRKPFWVLLLAGVPWLIYLASLFFRGNGGAKFRKIFRKAYCIALPVVMFALLSVTLTNGFAPRYYRYDDQVYCYYHDSYYVYSDVYDDYSVAYPPADLTANKDVYAFDTNSPYWNSDYSFTDSDYYEDHFDNDSDSDYDWDSSDSWDSGGTDWGSDW